MAEYVQFIADLVDFIRKVPVWTAGIVVAVFNMFVYIPEGAFIPYF